MTRRVLVVGGGIAGLAAAFELTRPSDGPEPRVELWEAADRLGGKIATSPFAGLEHIDESADAFLTRVPSAIGLADEVGLSADDLTSPDSATAAVWHDGLHDIPGGLVLGVPSSVRPFIGTKLLSWPGKLRAGLEPLLPRTDHGDSIGRLMRARFGDEVHERLVDALVGSIYATDTDASSLAAVPQLASLADRHRSLLLGARAARAAAPPPSPERPIFNAPRKGMGGLVDAVARAAADGGAVIGTGRAVTTVEADGAGFRVDGERFDAVVLATPGRTTAPLLRGLAPAAADLLDGFEHSDVIMVRLAVPGSDWPERLHGRSGYLVPKPDQRHVTAASFASQKWAHWRPESGDQILRVSLGRDGLPVEHLSDEDATALAIDEVGHHIGVDLQPTEISVTRWMDAFPQYRPKHHERVDRLDGELPVGLVVAGASYRGIGVPACIADGRRAARHVLDSLSSV